MYSRGGRSILRSAAVRKLLGSTAKAKGGPSPFGIPRGSKPQPRVFSCPVEMCSMQPYHTATASALMTSMLTLHTAAYACLPQGAGSFGYEQGGCNLQSCND